MTHLSLATFGLRSNKLLLCLLDISYIWIFRNNNMQGNVHKREWKHRDREWGWVIFRSGRSERLNLGCIYSKPLNISDASCLIDLRRERVWPRRHDTGGEKLWRKQETGFLYLRVCVYVCVACAPLSARGWRAAAPSPLFFCLSLSLSGSSSLQGLRTY